MNIKAYFIILLLLVVVAVDLLLLALHNDFFFFTTFAAFLAWVDQGQLQLVDWLNSTTINVIMRIAIMTLLMVIYLQAVAQPLTRGARAGSLPCLRTRENEVHSRWGQGMAQTSKMIFDIFMSHF